MHMPSKLFKISTIDSMDAQEICNSSDFAKDCRVFHPEYFFQAGFPDDLVFSCSCK